MSVIDRMRRFATDLSVENNDGWAKPNESIRELEKNAHKMDPEVRLQQLDHVTRNAVGYHLDRHGERRLPIETIQRLNTVEARIMRMNARDSQIQAARQALEGYGGPPNRHTVREAVARSETKSMGGENGKVNAIINGTENAQVKEQATRVSRSRGRQQEQELSV